MCDALYHINQAFTFWSRLQTDCFKAFYDHSSLKQWVNYSEDVFIDNQLKTFGFLNAFLQSK